MKLSNSTTNQPFRSSAPTANRAPPHAAPAAGKSRRWNKNSVPPWAAKVQLSQTAKGRGKIVIHFSNHDEFDRIRSHLTHSAMPQSQTG